VNGYLLDTNIPSETSKPRPAPQVMDWLRAAPQERLFLSAVTITELVRGIVRQRDRVQRALLQDWFDLSVRKWFEDESLSVTDSVAERAGQLIGQRDLAGQPLALADALIAATAMEYDLTLVTRNTRDFITLNVRLINPWEYPSLF
jgi:predicted nucleic acid-binding protein